MNKVKDYFNCVDRLTKMHLTTDELPVVALAGPYNTGKSTMVNNLLGRQVSPVDVLPTTRVPILFGHGKFFSITARLADGRIKVLSNGELESLSKGIAPFAGQVVIVKVDLNHELLYKMRLADTPGFDAATGTGELPSMLAEADHIVYMLHQRGTSEADRKFIGRLLESAGAEKISFWINRNLGYYDGTSLSESRRVLREICGREIQVHVTDTMNREAVRRFRLFIENRAAGAVIGKVTRRLKELDQQIPELTAAALHEKSEAMFLLRFWDAAQAAGRVIRGRDTIKTLPPVSQQIRNLVDELIKPEQKPAGALKFHRVQGPTPDPALVRDKIRSLLDRAAGDPALRSRKETAALLRALAEEVAGERFLVTAAGGFSTGKTTFFNALLGEALLPAEDRPTTFTVTRLLHGNEKKAVVKFAHRVTIPTHYVEKNHAVICRHELEVLEHWLTDPVLCSEISLLEKVQNGRSTNISPGELIRDIERLKETFARVKSRPPSGGRSWKSLFKRIPLHKFKGGKQADCFIVHFPHRENMELDLTGETGIEMLQQAAGSHPALRVKEIEVRHPADILRTAEFLDTPGLDSVYHRHREITTRYLAESDCFLFFLHGKHILTRPDLGIYNIITKILDHTENSTGKIFIIVNFADALSEREKERVCNYLHANLVRSSRDTPGPAGIYLVSALDALSGRDDPALSRLTAGLKERIWLSRCAANYAGIIRRAGLALASLLEEESPSPPTYMQRGGLFQQDKEQVLQETAQTLVGWRKIIKSLNSPADFLGFRDGQKPVKKGFLGLARKTVPYPSCRDLAAEINTILTRFQSKWYPGADTTINGLNIATLKDILDGILKDKNFQPGKARASLYNLLDKEELRIREALQQLSAEKEKDVPGVIKTAATGPNRSLFSVVTKYTRELETLEKEIITPGGNADGKRQDAR